MSRRRQESELLFGSDSFLDVMCNMVGILIILIVVVSGMRIARPAREIAAVEEVSPAVTAPAVTAPVAAPESGQSVAELAVEPEHLPELPPLQEIRPSPEMLKRAEELRDQNQRLLSELEKLKAEQSKLTNRRLDIAEQTQVLRKQITEKIDTIKNDRTQITTLETNVVGIRAEVLALQQRIDDYDPNDAPVEQLTHRLPPIGKVVTGDEIHFRLDGNRVSQVPLEMLAKEVQRDLERRKEILISRSFYQGSTRPIQGYMMEYVMQRMAMSMAEELRTGTGMVRIGVSSWVIRAVGPIHAESADEAMRSDSAFRRALREASPTATVTFWVYPDSFEILRKLTNASHDANLWVASRPLPAGVPIAGSPEGSKSVAQ